MPRLSGTMKVSDEKFSAIWWAATWVLPNLATSSAIKLKALLSAK